MKKIVNLPSTVSLTKEQKILLAKLKKRFPVVDKFIDEYADSSTAISYKSILASFLTTNNMQELSQKYRSFIDSYETAFIKLRKEYQVDFNVKNFSVSIEKSNDIQMIIDTLGNMSNFLLLSEKEGIIEAKTLYLEEEDHAKKAALKILFKDRIKSFNELYDKSAFLDIDLVNSGSLEINELSLTDVESSKLLMKEKLMILGLSTTTLTLLGLGIWLIIK